MEDVRVAKGVGLRIVWECRLRLNHVMSRANLGKYTPLLLEWKAKQRELREKLIISPLRDLPRFVAGADVAFSPDKQRVLAAAVVYDRERRQIVEVVHADRPIEFPYIPAFLSFREGPTLLDAIAKL